MRSPSLVAQIMKEKAKTNKVIQTPNQKYCQNPPDSTTVVKIAVKIQSIPVTTKPMSFAIVVASGNRDRRRSVAGACDRLIFMKFSKMQIAGHESSNAVTHCVSGYYV